MPVSIKVLKEVDGKVVVKEDNSGQYIEVPENVLYNFFKMKEATAILLFLKEDRHIVGVFERWNYVDLSRKIPIEIIDHPHDVWISFIIVNFKLE